MKNLIGPSQNDPNMAMQSRRLELKIIVHLILTHVNTDKFEFEFEFEFEFDKFVKNIDLELETCFMVRQFTIESYD